MKEDVTEALEAIGEVLEAIDDLDVVLCATGFQDSWDLLGPW